MILRRIIKAMVPQSIRKKLRPVLEDMAILKAPGTNISTDILVKPYKRIGILNYETDDLSGENFLVKRIVPALLQKPNPILMDVGANLGDYTLKLIKAFPSAEVHAFEPSKETYAKLIENVPRQQVRCVAKGLSDNIGTAPFFDYAEAAASAHASLHQDVLIVLHQAAEVKSFPIELTTLDHYCETEKIDRVDFIKIDTEGNELAVLKGARQLISQGKLPIAQFEFNEMNIISKSFLRDFYALLIDYAFFRLMPRGLLPLGPYHPRNEIFAFQNILAIRSGFCSTDIIAPFLVTVEKCYG